MSFDAEKLEKLDYRPFVSTDDYDEVKLITQIRDLNLSLPDDYLQFLSRFPCTGFFFSENPVVCLGENPSAVAPGGRYLVSSLFAKCSNPQFDLIEFYLDDSYMDDLMPKHFLIIGDSDGGNYFCMDLRDESAGTIYFYDHEHSDNEDGLTIVARSFSSFIERLREQTH